MTTLKLIYLHGFNSSPQSAKAQELMARVAELPAADRPLLLVPELPHRPAQAMALVTRLIDQIGTDGLTLIGSSLGGYYATYLAERHAAANVRAVLLNPTTGPAADLRPYFGPQRNLYTGELYELTEEHLREFLTLKVDRLTRPERYYLLARTGDELLDYRLAVAHYAGAYQLILGGGNHDFEDFGRHIDSILRFAGVPLARAPEPAPLTSPPSPPCSMR
jgi:hypothetical protein